MNAKRVTMLILIVVAVVLFLLNRREVKLTAQNNFELKRIASSGYELNSVIHFYNSNLLSSTIQSINEKFFINGKQVGELNNEIEQGIPGMKESALPVSVRFSEEDLLSIFPNGILINQLTEVTVSGEINFRNLVGGGTITVNEKDSVVFK